MYEFSNSLDNRRVKQVRVQFQQKIILSNPLQCSALPAIDGIAPFGFRDYFVHSVGGVSLSWLTENERSFPNTFQFSGVERLISETNSVLEQEYGPSVREERGDLLC